MDATDPIEHSLLVVGGNLSKSGVYASVSSATVREAISDDSV